MLNVYAQMFPQLRLKLRKSDLLSKIQKKHSAKATVAFEALRKGSRECFLSIKPGNSLLNTAHMQTER